MIEGNTETTAEGGITLRKVEKHIPCHETLSVTVLPSPKMPVIETGGAGVGEKQGTVVEEG